MGGSGSQRLKSRPLMWFEIGAASRHPRLEQGSREECSQTAPRERPPRSVAEGTRTKGKTTEQRHQSATDELSRDPILRRALLRL